MATDQPLLTTPQLMSAKMEIILVSWIVSIEADLRAGGGIHSWNLSLVLHQLTKAPFEPLKEASLKHLTFMSVFLLALGSGKRRSEIHARLHKNIRHQSDCLRCPCTPHPAFYPRTSWLRRVQIVWPQW